MPGTDPFRLRLVSINTWKCDGDYPARMAVLARQLAALAPDVVALQESFATVDGSFDTAAALARHLDMAYGFVPERRKPRLVGGRLLDSHSGLAVLSRRPADEQLALPLPSTTEDGGRSAQLMRWQQGGRYLVIGNVHLSHLSDGGHLRQQQLECLLGHPWFDERNVALVCGDFNVELSAPEFRAVLARPRCWQNACAGLAAKTTYRPSDGSARDLDHILLGPGGAARIVDASVVLDAPDPETGEMASDHCGVSAEIALPSAP